ncbi:MAG: hypothetical protein QM703_01065 [Gemmatales bacterium]
MKQKKTGKKKAEVGHITLREVQQLKKTVRELTRERDLYRKEWQKAMEDVVPLKMTRAEADAIVAENISLDSVIQEIEEKMRKNKSA